MKFKIMTYNILNGLCNDNPPFKIQKNRLKIISKIIDKENPDILVLCEAYLWSFAKRDSLKDMNKNFSSLYKSYALADYNFRWAPIVLSKFPVEKFETAFSKYSLNHLRTRIRVNGKFIVLDVFHPNPRTSEKEKEDFFKPILKKISGNYILTGDFNSLSPEDSYNKEKFVKGYVGFMKKDGKKKAEDMLTCRAVKGILAKNLIDTYKKINDKLDFTMPTDLRSKNKDSASRLDYIFCSKNFKIVESGIIKNKLTEKASDHYPVYAVLEMK